jgi:SEC-C motif-containing protein
MQTSMERCPCGRDATYEACCGTYHRGAEPSDAETLMRSRYAAFVKKDARYLHRTLHRSHDEGEKDLVSFEAGLRKHFASGFLYRALRVHGTRAEDEEGTSKVLFTVSVAQRGKDVSFSEVSSFARENGAIRYLAGITMEPSLVRDLEGADAVATAEQRARGR